MRWAIVTHPDQWINGRLALPPKAIAEDCVPAAVAQKWIVLARDSDFPVKPMNRHLLSNPHRIRKHRDHGYGYTEGET